jgi:hypothetical protein
MYQFSYQKAKSLSDAAAALAKNADARLLAGGQTLIASMKMRLVSPSDLVDLSGIAELRGIKIDGSIAHHRRDDEPRGCRRIQRSQESHPRTRQTRWRDRRPHDS